MPAPQYRISLDTKLRNVQLLELIKTHFPKGTRLFGNPENPAIISGDLSYSAAVMGYNLLLFDAPTQAKIVGKIVLAQKLSENDLSDLTTWLNNKEYHRTVYRLKVPGTALYFANYGYSDWENRTGMFPLFSFTNEKVYFKRKYAEDKLSEFTGLELEIV